MAQPSPATIRAMRGENPKPRARDFAQSTGISEADLVAAFVGYGTTVLEADPDRLIPWVAKLGDVMALTRNEHCVHERRGTYNHYRTGAFAAMVLDAEIDLRIFPKHWQHAYAVEESGAEGPKRSIQIFDAAGDAVHKVHLKPESDHDQFAALIRGLRHPEQSDTLALTPRKPVEAARGDAWAAPGLRVAWDAMSDTHQFLGLMKEHQMNRLGAYRVAGPRYAQRLEPVAVTKALEACAQDAIALMIFVGNAGCIQIHGGEIGSVVPMGPWINVMDPRFNLHLRADKIAEVYRVWKPTRTGDVHSIEAFDAQGELILQLFGYRKHAPAVAWDAMTKALPQLEEVGA